MQFFLRNGFAAARSIPSLHTSPLSLLSRRLITRPSSHSSPRIPQPKPKVSSSPPLQNGKPPSSSSTSSSSLPPPSGRTSSILPRLPRPLRFIILPLATLMLYSPIFYCIHTHVFQIMWITGPSMYPFLNTDYYGTTTAQGSAGKQDSGKIKAAANSSTMMTTKDCVLVWMWNAHHDLHRGEIIAFHSPKDPEKLLVKRIIALEGDYVRNRDSSSNNNNNNNSNKAISRTVVSPFGEVIGIVNQGWEQVPQGHVWVEGENGAEAGRWSWDSNVYGPISRGLVMGRVKAVVWPWGKAGWIRWEDWRGSGRVREGRLKERIEAHYG